MSHLVAYVGNDPEHLECALVPARVALQAHLPSEKTGWGLGFVQGGDVLLQKRPRSLSSEVDFFAHARDLRADAFLARGGLTDEARASADNADPFRFRWWLFGSIGQIAGFDQVRERMLTSIPDFLRRNIRGTSPSEHLFHLFLAFMHDAGLLEGLAPDPEPVEKALHESINFLERLLSEVDAPKLRLASVTTNGRCMVARSSGRGMQYLTIDGIMDCTVCRQRNALERDDRRIIHDQLRGVVVEVAEADEPRAGWKAVPLGAGLAIGPDKVATVVS